jgi:hypothetical protein
VTDTVLLKAKIAEKGLKYTFLARQLKLSNGAFRNKLENRSEWKQSEIVCLRDIMDISDKDVRSIFLS